MPESINFNKDTDILMTKEYEPKITTLRKSEYTSVNLIAMDGTLFIASYTTKTHAEIESVTNIARTIFVCIVLIIASLTFTKDAQTLVVDPLERMIEKVRLMSKNPLAAATEEIHEAGLFTFMDKDK